MVRARFVLTLLAVLFSGCSPGLVLHLYNTTEETLTVSYQPYRMTDTIQPHTAADIGIAGGFVVSAPTRSWFYHETGPPPAVALFQQHTMLWRAFGRIDTPGRIYVLAPPAIEGAAPHDIPQPKGFPLQPHKRPNQSSQRPHCVVTLMCVQQRAAVAYLFLLRISPQLRALRARKRGAVSAYRPA